MVVEQTIVEKLKQAFEPVFLQVENESHMHSVPANSETHFKVTLVSEVFNGMRQVAMHQKVYAVLQEELQGEVHALALHTYTPEKWQQNRQVPDSPNCLGGSKHG